MSYEGTTEEVDLQQYPNAQVLYDSCLQFFSEIDNLYACDPDM